MSEDDPETTAEVEITVGQAGIRIKASEQFIERELPTILDWVDSTDAEVEQDEQTQEQERKSRSDDAVTQASLPVSETGNGVEESDTESDSKITEVARRLNVKSNKLSNHFYIDKSENTVHIQDPRNIEPKYALLGLCDIREKLTDNTYHDNSKMKKKLINQEKVDIERWGSSLLYGLRRKGLIKDDPNSDRQRNKPFKITPTGHQEFVQWLEESE